LVGIEKDQAVELQVEVEEQLDQTGGGEVAADAWQAVDVGKSL